MGRISNHQPRRRLWGGECEAADTKAAAAAASLHLWDVLLPSLCVNRCFLIPHGRTALLILMCSR